eukprot:c8718_g1_i1.p1 GENE.c8718_g1_i1~~c8718_g1_i1.p1  ORF type:complete len:319 (-),score=58.64 c8718_g1_i1:172-1089(-)
MSSSDAKSPTSSNHTTDPALYIAQLIAEKERLAPLQSFLSHTIRLLNAEIQRAEGKSTSTSNTALASTMGLVEVGSIRTETSITDGKLVRKVFVPVELKPSFNFVGRLLGHRGTTLQSIESESGAKLLIRGKGSTRADKGPAVSCKFGEKCSRRDSCTYRHPDDPEDDGKHADHLKEPLHVLIMSTPDATGENAMRIAQTLLEPLLIPDDRIPSTPYDSRRLMMENTAYPSVMPGAMPVMDPVAYQTYAAAYHNQFYAAAAAAAAASTPAGAAGASTAHQSYGMYQPAHGSQSAHTNRFQPYPSY